MSAEQGRGFTVAVGEVFAATLRARLQIRNTVQVEGDVVSDTFELRTARIWWTGSVLDPSLRYGLQLALGANDFEPGNASPIFDAYVESTHLRELNVRVGQFFVPFDRARTVRESALMTTDRSEVVRELTLDRDIGIVVSSADLFGLGGILGYAVGFFGGDGRNRVAPAVPGFLYTARIYVRPMGAFNDDQESDLARSPDPRLISAAPSPTTPTPTARGARPAPAPFPPSCARAPTTCTSRQTRSSSGGASRSSARSSGATPIATSTRSTTTRAPRGPSTPAPAGGTCSRRGCLSGRASSSGGAGST